MNTRLLSMAAAAVALPIICPGQSQVTRQRLWEGVDSVVVINDEPVTEQRGNAERSNRWMPGGSPDPVLTLYAPDTPTGASCLVFPGGGYGGLAIDKEGHFPAAWLAERGVLGVVVPYRCGGGSDRYPVPQMDGQRAVRFLRANAERLGIALDQIGVMGFSAGGHLAASLATSAGGPVAPPDDPLAEVSARPDFAVLVYPVISMRADVTHGGSRRQLLGEKPTDESVAALSADEQVTPPSSPTLLIHSADDGAVPLANPMRYFDACQRHGVEAELHVYPTGGHGYGMWAEQGSVSGWPAVLENWLQSRGYATP